MPDFSLREIQSLPVLSDKKSAPSEGSYVIKTDRETSLYSESSEISNQIWFQTPALKIDTVRRIRSVQLLAESHDQGFVSDENAGNWTWFELAILENENAVTPRIKDDVELVWRSHRNRFQKEDYDWKEGDVFRSNDDMLRLIEDGNVIAVRLCARFVAWEIFAREGYLLFEIGGKPIVREALSFGGIVSEIKSIHETILEVDVATKAAFLPPLPDTLFRADVLSTGGERPLRVLSLDGGGVRGLASLYLLKAVMARAKITKKPCEVFDMIGGTSAGGLIAIMLGRLEMEIDDCIAELKTFMTTVFVSSWLGKKGDFFKNGEFYDAGVVEKAVKAVVKRRLGSEDVPLYDDKHRCKIFCMAVRREGANNHAPIFLRSYKNPQEMSLLPDIKVWEAARATSAAPAYFAPMKVGDYELLDGGLQANNPLGWLWTEVLSVFGPARNTDCFLSIGTGITSNMTLPKPGRLGSHDVEEGFASIATNTQITHILFRALLNAFAPQAQGKKYWRLNIGTEIPEHLVTKTGWFGGKTTEKALDNYESIGELDDIAALKNLTDKTDQYIKDQESTLQECADSLLRNLS